MDNRMSGEEVHSFGDWLRQQRKARDWSQAALAQRVGCTAATIRKIEADERKPSAQLAALLANALEVPDHLHPLFLQVARQLRSIAHLTASPSAPTAARAQPPTPLPTNRLPTPMTSLVDRLRDTAIVTGLLTRADVRLLTLLGPPGIGKTRLAIHSAEQLAPHFADGVCFVDLSPLTDARWVLPTIAQSLAIAETGTTPLLERLRDLLIDKRLLFVLDNCEQVNEAANEIGVLLRGCKGVKVLATSRIALLLAGEHEYPLPPLSLPPQENIQTIGPEQLIAFESVQLFAARVRQHQHHFAITPENAKEVAAICLRLDGLPLALELAAAALRRMTLSQACRDSTHRRALAARTSFPGARSAGAPAHAAPGDWLELWPVERGYATNLSAFGHLCGRLYTCRCPRHLWVRTGRTRFPGRLQPAGAFARALEDAGNDTRVRPDSDG